MPFCYPVVIGTLETLVQMCMKGGSSMLYLTLFPPYKSQLCHATFWLVVPASNPNPPPNPTPNSAPTPTPTHGPTPTPTSTPNPTPNPTPTPNPNPNQARRTRVGAH